MATIRVNSTVMREKATAFKTVATSIQTYTNDMITEIDSLKTTWEGEAAETLVNKFKGLAENFEAICKTINQYGDFLDQAAVAYDDTEKANTQGAQNQA
ncbi:MAG: WXG100 family type VII secretion target [Firmicutes bacterium]|nr:WXG100 family type VII secretion target [Bacillota bacterium]MBR6684473.1 WXG100 family type VII secretion target [Bacillota bacterium]